MVSFETPSHDDIVTFRNPTKLAFDRLTFRDSPNVPSPGDEVFSRVLETALEKDSAGDDDDDDLLLPPSSLGQRGAATNGKGRSEATHDSSDESSAASEAEKTQSDDEEWLRGGGEDAGYASFSPDASSPVRLRLTCVPSAASSFPSSASAVKKARGGQLEPLATSRLLRRNRERRARTRQAASYSSGLMGRSDASRARTCSRPGTKTSLRST